MKKIIKKLLFLNTVGIVGSKILMIASTVLAATLVTYSGYALWDSVYTSQAAFVNNDLTQYKPEIVEDEKPSLEDMQEINKDTVAWLTIYNTNIDYPVVHGEDDLEYANKDIYGKASLTGTIYLSAENEGFNDPYCIIYGHHMDNGAMFGDIGKYTDRTFFSEHKYGLLVTPEQIYDLEIFAAVKTDAYDKMVYGITDKNYATLPSFVNWLSQHSEVYDAIQMVNNDQLLALSTCADESTYGRTIAFAKKTPHEGPIPDEYEVIKESRTPLANWHGKDYWALLNLICAILTCYICLPLHRLFSKFKRNKNMKKFNEIYEEAFLNEEEKDGKRNNSEINESNDETDANLENQEEKQTLLYQQKKFKKRSIVGVILEVIIAIIAVIVFILTENIWLRITIVDKWTPLMIIILVACWIVDIRLLRYREDKDIHRIRENTDFQYFVDAGKSDYTEELEKDD